jgi:hypothetical protein
MVVLKPLTAAIEKVQVGTDKTAAELALNRLRLDLQTLTEERDGHKEEANITIEQIRKDGSNAVFWAAGFVAWLFGTALCQALFGPEYAILGLGIGIVVGLILRSVARSKEEAHIRHLLTENLKPIEIKMLNIHEKIRVNRAIVDS